MTSAMPTIVEICTRRFGVHRQPIPGEAPEPRKAAPKNQAATHKPRAKWGPQYVAMLGKVSDGELGSIMGMSKYTVRDERVRRGIPAYNGAIEWDEPKIKALGTDTDIVISARLGVSKSSVVAKRRELGIKPHVAHKSHRKQTTPKP